VYIEVVTMKILLAFMLSVSVTVQTVLKSVFRMTPTLSICDMDLLQFNVLTYIPCHSILSPVHAVRASTAHICYVAGRLVAGF